MFLTLILHRAFCFCLTVIMLRILFGFDVVTFGFCLAVLDFGFLCEVCKFTSLVKFGLLLNQIYFCCEFFVGFLGLCFAAIKLEF